MNYKIFKFKESLIKRYPFSFLVGSLFLFKWFSYILFAGINEPESLPLFFIIACELYHNRGLE